MSWRQLLRHNLWFHRRAHLAMLLGVLVGTAVLTGSLLLGDSLKGSLRDLTYRRLGRIDFALASDRFFPESLGERLKAVPILMLRGSAVTRNADGSLGSRAGQVQVVGIDDRFGHLFDEKLTDLGSEVLVNEPLAKELGLAAGGNVELRLERPQAVPAESVIGQRNQPEGLVVPESKVRAVLPLASTAPYSMGRFNLATQQSEPKLVFVQLRRLQRLLEREADLPANRANVLLATGNGNFTDAAPLQAALRKAATLDDLGLVLRLDHTKERYVSLETRRMILEPELVAKVEALAKARGWTCVPTLTYLANKISRVTLPTDEPQPVPRSFTPYSAITSLDPAAKAPLGPLVLASGTPATALGDDEVLLSEFTAQDLWPGGDWQKDIGKPVVRIDYFVEGGNHELIEKQAVLKLAGVVPLAGAAADRSLTPEFPGLRGTRIADWKPPFPAHQWHKEWIRERDEAFYRQHRVTPKAFVSPTLAKKLWASRYGDTTSLRFTAPGKTPAALEADLRAALLETIKPEDVGLRWLPVMALGLAATSSGTANMFGGLFVGFSLFLIVAAALLVGLLFRLGLEQRAREWGLYYALGYPAKVVRRLVLTEGLLVAVLGAALGLLAGLAYTWLLIEYLRRGWKGSLESSFLELHVLPGDPAMPGLPYPSLLIGFLASLFIAGITLLWSLRGFAKLAPRSLMGGDLRSLPPGGRGLGWGGRTRLGGRLLAMGAIVLALLLLAGSLAVPRHQAASLFFGAGFLLLIGGLATLKLWLNRQQRSLAAASLSGLGISYASRNASRSLLTAGLLAVGTFLVVAVQAFRQSAPEDGRKDSGTGGFTLVAQSDVALPVVPSDEAAWKQLATSVQGEDGKPPGYPKGATVYGLRLRGGDDVSCLNLYQPQKPRVLGVPTKLIERGSFRFQLPADATDAEKANPWTLLLRGASPPQPSPSRREGATPILADDHAAQWVLQKQIGDVWDLEDENGQPVKVQLVGLFTSSLFQSELLMSEEHFRQLFPSTAGYRFFLIDASGQGAAVKTALDGAFGEAFGLNVETAAARLASFQAVENTYLSTFQALGGLGLLLGSAGLGVVLLRNLNERRGEWALLRALGYSQANLVKLALVENATLILAGLLIGLVSAGIAVGPQLVGSLANLPWGSLLLIVFLIPLVGLLAGAVAVRAALRVPLLPALARE